MTEDEIAALCGGKKAQARMIDRPPRLGATGTFPRGKLRPDDEGGLAIGIAVDVTGNVVLDFAKPVAWVAMPKAQAIEFAKRIMFKAGAKKVEVTL